MHVLLTGSVGAAGLNRRADVEAVQRLLAARGNYRGRIDGLCGPATTAAIVQIQRGFMAHPDGRVDRTGVTWGRLTDKSAAPALVPANRPAPLPPAKVLSSTVRLPERSSLNPGLVAVTPDFMVKQLGKPRETYSSDCQSLTNSLLKRHVVTRSMGRFSVTGLKMAVESLEKALIQARNEQPALHAVLGTAGMLCCRYVRGSNTAVSNHSWGTAIDFTLEGVLDRRGDDRVQVGLALLAPIMNQHGWYWGASFRTEDAMHFEASRTLITRWATELR